MTLLYDLMVWLEQDREMGLLVPDSGKRGRKPPPLSPPILYPTAGLAGSLMGLQGQAGSGSYVLCIIPNTLAFSAPPLPGASGIPAGCFFRFHTLDFICESFQLDFHFSQLAYLSTLQMPDIADYI